MRVATLWKVAGLIAGSAMSLSAQEQIVTPSNPAWFNSAGENSGGGSSAISATAPRSGNGSVEMFGDRTRYQTGNQYFVGPQTNLGLLSDVMAFGFDWMVANNSTALLNPDYTPALRLHIKDGAQRSELIWEGAYNGVYGSMNEGTWYTTDAANGNLYQFVTGSGVTLVGGSQVNQSLAAWKGAYSANAYVAAISVGVGGSAGAGYHAFADNVVYGVGNTTTTFNFETTAVVPEPSTYVLMGSGLLGLAGFARRRRRA